MVLDAQVDGALPRLALAPARRPAPPTGGRGRRRPRPRRRRARRPAARASGPSAAAKASAIAPHTRVGGHHVRLAARSRRPCAWPAKAMQSRAGVDGDRAAGRTHATWRYARLRSSADERGCSAASGASPAASALEQPRARRRARRPTAWPPRRRPARAQVTTEPTENQCDWTATPSSPVCGSCATMEYVPRAACTDEPLRASSRACARSRAGFVRTYGDVSPGAPRYAGHRAAPTRATDVPVVARRARRRLAGQGRAPARAAARPRACRSAASASTCAWHDCPSMWIAARDPARAAAARLPPRHRARSSARCPSCASSGRLLHLLIRHTSASLTLNENASPDVRRDFESWFNAPCPRTSPYWTHTLEGADDMPAHVKASLLGPSLTLPVRDGRLALGHLAGHLPVRAPRPRRRRGR